MKKLIVAVALLGLAAVGLQAQVKVDASIAAYQKQSGVSGNVNSVGSDTMNNMMALWG
jgi:phosphate transport system substrate-binding protein